MIRTSLTPIETVTYVSANMDRSSPSPSSGSQPSSSVDFAGPIRTMNEKLIKRRDVEHAKIQRAFETRLDELNDLLGRDHAALCSDAERQMAARRAALEAVSAERRKLEKSLQSVLSDYTASMATAKAELAKIHQEAANLGD